MGAVPRTAAFSRVGAGGFDREIPRAAADGLGLLIEVIGGPFPDVPGRIQQTVGAAAVEVDARGGESTQAALPHVGIEGIFHLAPGVGPPIVAASAPLPFFLCRQPPSCPDAVGPGLFPGDQHHGQRSFPLGVGAVLAVPIVGLGPVCLDVRGWDVGVRFQEAGILCIGDRIFPEAVSRQVAGGFLFAIGKFSTGDLHHGVEIARISQVAQGIGRREMFLPGDVAIFVDPVCECGGVVLLLVLLADGPDGGADAGQIIAQQVVHQLLRGGHLDGRVLPCWQREVEVSADLGGGQAGKRRADAQYSHERAQRLVALHQ